MTVGECGRRFGARRIAFLCVSVAVATAIAGVIGVLRSCCSDRSVEGVILGMNRSRVEELLGLPHAITGDVIWYRNRVIGGPRVRYKDSAVVDVAGEVTSDSRQETSSHFSQYHEGELVAIFGKPMTRTARSRSNSGVKFDYVMLTFCCGFSIRIVDCTPVSSKVPASKHPGSFLFGQDCTFRLSTNASLVRIDDAIWER